MHGMRRRVGLALTAALVLGACSASDGGPEEVTLPDVALAAALRPFDACDDLLEHVRREALERVGPYGLEGSYGPLMFEDRAMAEANLGAGGDGDAAPAASAPQAGTDYSTTNVQVEGVDEPDVVKTDGRRVLAVAGGKLHVVDVTGSDPRLVSSLELGEGWGHEIFWDGDRVLVLVTADGGVRPALRSGDAWFGGTQSVLTEVDLSDPASPRVLRRLALDGAYLSARLVDGVARVVLRADQPVGIEWAYPEGSGILAERRAEEENRRLIEESTLEDWMPYFVLEGANGSEEGAGLLLDCERTHHPEEFSGFGVLTLVTVDLDAGLGVTDSVGVLAGGETVYASAENLYVATNRWPEAEELEDPQTDEGFTTQVHRFDITAAAATDYVGSGEVRGHLLNQFSMDEHDGHLRVATTDGAPWGAGDASESFVTVLARQGDALVPVGQVGGLGRGEQIHSVRFMGDRGYVVTFRQTDPLYVVDLSEPSGPRVTGELKILGYSAYLHPVGDGLLLGVGQDATEEGRRLGTQVSLFDVSDAAAPVRLAQVGLGSGSSEVEWDHRAFLYWAPTGLTVVPVEEWAVLEQGEQLSTGAVAFTVDPAGTIAELGRVTHQRLAPIPRPDRAVVPPEASPQEEGVEPGQSQPAAEIMPYDYDWGTQIRRSLVVGELLFTMSERGLLASDLGSLAERAWLPFPA